MTDYSAIQKISMAAIVVGAAMCIAGGLAPYWIESDPEGLGFIGSLVGQVVKGHMGLFMVCLEVLNEKGCELFDSEDGWFNKERVFAVVCILFGMVAGFTALCLACCTCCQRLICLGILSFLSAAAGVACAVTYSQNTELFTASISGFKFASYGWAFYVFCVGVGLLALASFPACFATPERSTVGVGQAFNQPQPTTVMVNMDSNTGYYANPQWQGQGQYPLVGGPWQGHGQGHGQVMPGQVMPGQVHDPTMIHTPVTPGVSMATTKQ